MKTQRKTANKPTPVILKASELDFIVKALMQREQQLLNTLSELRLQDVGEHLLTGLMEKYNRTGEIIEKLSKL